MLLLLLLLLLLHLLLISVSIPPAAFPWAIVWRATSVCQNSATNCRQSFAILTETDRNVFQAFTLCTLTAAAAMVPHNGA